MFEPIHCASNDEPRQIRRRASIFNFAVSLCLVTAFVIALPTTIVEAQRGTVVTRQVRFARGRTSTTLRGTATWGTSYRYLLQANAGQTMSVRVTGAPTATVMFYPPEAGTEPLDGAEDVQRWSGVLPETGRYAIFVSQTGIEGNSAPYTLTISIR